MFNFMERTMYDRIEGAVLEVCRDAIEEGNVPFLQRGLPTIAIAEQLDDVRDEDAEVVATQVAISAFDSSDPLMYTPKAIHLNEEILNELSDEDIRNVIKRALRYDAEYVDTKDMHDTELTLFDKDGDELELPVTITALEWTTEDLEEEDGTSGSSTTTIDLEALSEMMKKISEEVEAEVEAEEEETKAKVDKYKMSLKDPKTSTIVSKSNERYKASSLSDKEYESRLEKVAEVQDILDSAIESSGMSKIPSDTPDKRLAIRNVVIGHHKEYLSNKMMYGKKLDIVVVLDRSGSMGGAPARDSAILITALNNLCHLYPELTCTVLFSDADEYDMMNFPTGDINSKELLEFTQTHGAEGIAENMDKELPRLEKADCVFVYSDGNICSSIIDKSRYTALGIELTGLYTAIGTDGGKLTLEDYRRHYNKNSSWFHNVIISTKPTDLAEHMVDYMVG
jgi:hypothetical protein